MQTTPLFKLFNQDSPVSEEERESIAEQDHQDLIEEVLEQDSGIGAPLTRKKVENMTPYELIDHSLKWEGLIGFTDSIIHLVVKALGFGLTEEELYEILK